MRLTLPTTEYMVHFTHVAESKNLSNVMTICTLHEGRCLSNERPCNTPGAVNGIAHCSRKDNFEKAVGRKVSFDRAVNQLLQGQLVKEIRAELWDEYMRKFKMPRGKK